jgi:hypothetical protein
MSRAISKRRGAPLFRFEISRLQQNIFPVIYPDYTLLDRAVAACKKRNFSELNQLVKLSEGIYQLRSAQALRSAVTLDENAISRIPDGISTETDEALRLMADMRRLAAQGLGLTIPVDMPLQRYLELVKDYQRPISELVATLSISGQPPKFSPEDFVKKINQLNGEIDRIRNLKRHVVLEASIAMFRQHKGLIATALLASALGLAGTLVGFASAVAASAGVKVARKRGWLIENPGAQRVKEMILRDLQPHMDKLGELYT